jgi:hypothetical protein
VPREVTDPDGIAWSCIQAYAGLNTGDENQEAAEASAGAGRVTVVCTPSGAARSVRLELPVDWESAVDDDALLGSIADGLAAG